MSKPELIVCGSIAEDRLMAFSGRYRDIIEPSKLDTLSVSVLVDSVHRVWGGIGANISHNVALLGDEVVLYGSVGVDGDDYMERLASEGVDVSRVRHSDLTMASFSVFTDSENNQVGGFYPGAMSDAAGMTFEPWKAEDIFVLLSPHDPQTMRAQTEECRRRGIRLFYDPGQQVTSISAEDLRAGIEAAELVAVNDYEHTLLLKKTGLSAEELVAAVPVLIVTKGDRGSVISGNSLPEPIEIPRANAVDVKDPGGAGDSYRAGFLYGYLRQWELAKCGKLGATVASFVVEQHGPQIQLSKTAIAERYQQTFNEEVELA